MLGDKIGSITFQETNKPMDSGKYGLPAMDITADGKGTMLGHDASAMSDLCPIAMLFVQSKDGLSHNPKEFSKESDMQVALRVLESLITNLKD